MKIPERRRTLILLVAVLLPSTALVGIAARMVRQEHELAQRRASQSRRVAIAQAGRELELAIDRIQVGATPDSVVVLATAVQNGEFQLPWQSNSNRSHTADSLLLAGTVAEFRGSYEDADKLYTAAAAQSRDSITPDLALLFRARNAARAGHVSQARSWYGQLLRLPLSRADEEAMPFALYAAGWLASRGEPRDSLRAPLVRDGALSGRPISRIALYGLRPYFSGPDSVRIEKQLSDAERLLAVRRDYRALLNATLQQDQNVWSAYGPEPWLVRADSTRVVIVRPLPLLKRNGVRIASASQANAEPHGAAFPGIYASISPSPLLDSSGDGGNLLLVMLLLTIILTAFSGIIVWRDVRREVAMAELRTQFVSSVSHELKTPLTAIRMYAEMLRMGMHPDVERQEEFVDTIVHESERLTRLINNVLDFSRIERGARVYQPEAVDLRDVASQIERAMSYLSRRDGFELSIRAEPNLPIVHVDRDALIQAILNLLSNAMKFSNGARCIELVFAKRAGSVCITVRDHGRGISAAVRPHVFENFYRAPDVEADGIPGTGIGLALVAHVARAHGGDVVVESEPGKGSTFSLQLPATS